ncbi:hypothetical protein G6011_00550 [Alternaria panax]|uniref:Uncharacterized protein n=1 Tax=Alternaria panax TaxID=48097 RepID=A0AAD4NV59_9PLEO|nr:hypothetical protein G6011_00550 [Alternaria panax]
MSGLPVYINVSEPTLFENFVQNSIDWLTHCFNHLFHGTCMEFWLLDPNGQVYTLFLNTLVVVSMWLLHTNQQLKALAYLGSAHDWLEYDVSVEGDVYGEPDEDDWPLPLSPGASPRVHEEIPIMRELAPPSHHSTNTHLESSPFRVAKPLGHRSRSSVAPGYQMPSASKSRLSKAFSTKPLQRDNDSDLAKDANISDKTSQGHVNGIPTKGGERHRNGGRVF